MAVLDSKLIGRRPRGDYPTELYTRIFILWLFYKQGLGKDKEGGEEEEKNELKEVRVLELRPKRFLLSWIPDSWCVVLWRVLYELGVGVVFPGFPRSCGRRFVGEGFR